MLLKLSRLRTWAAKFEMASDWGLLERGCGSGGFGDDFCCCCVRRDVENVRVVYKDEYITADAGRAE